MSINRKKRIEQIVKEDRWTRDKFNEFGYPLFAHIWGEDVSIEVVPLGDPRDFEGIDIKVKVKDKNVIYVSMRFRRFETKVRGKTFNVGDLDDITIREMTANGIPCEIEHMASTRFVYAVLNKDETAIYRWHLIKTRELIEAYQFDHSIAGKPIQNRYAWDTSFLPFPLKRLRKLKLVVKEGLPPKKGNIPLKGKGSFF